MDLKLYNLKNGKNRSTESGSSCCLPICRVGQDPNTFVPENVGRSPEKERADKKKDRKPTEVVRPQPSRPQPSRAQHLKTDNTGRAEYSTETEIYKPRPLPSISRPSDSPRPLPKRTPDDELEKGGIQLEPLVDSTSEKKKKKKRKKKETKQSDEEN
ncbi:EFNB [Mytilus coruscus]|uniref:EFNB n=1 Tax=Mytilus coruscus TaxID=42192 RepID=A0A6J8D5N5_MYTCO|nr:EFNB [Mytilus coruscus]